jgi:pyruvate-formate lyase-activating enzyme
MNEHLTSSVKHLSIEMTEKNSNQLHIDNMLERMADVETQSGSNTMCLAKWMQSTVYLMNGHTHSCHHPSVHKIPISEIKRKPSALHNTEHKMKVREEMLAGQRPKECQYCWNIENLPGKHISDRTYKSAWSWAYPNLQQIIESKNGADIVPSYLEVAFDNTCNLKCMYCTPDISSKWMEESQKYGPYPNTTYNVGDVQWLKQIGKMPIPSREDNPYVDAFWEWWPELYKSLHTFRITGGEPLLSKNTWRVLEEIKNNPRPDLTLAINTNMQVPDELLDRLIGYYNDIAPNIKSFDVYTSCEAHGNQAEYIRTGLQYDSFMDNIKRFLNNTGEHSRVHLMITFNILSLSTFDLFLNDILDLRSTYNETAAFNRMPMMISYLRWPQFQDVRVAPSDIKQRYIDRITQFVKAHQSVTDSNAGMFYLEEIDQVERLAEYMFEPLDAQYLHLQMKDFGAFYSEYDKRRELNFIKTFPELEQFYRLCKEA